MKLSLALFQAQMPYPEGGQIFDYKLDDGGASIFDDDEEEVKERKVRKVMEYEAPRRVESGLKLLDKISTEVHFPVPKHRKEVTIHPGDFRLVG